MNYVSSLCAQKYENYVNVHYVVHGELPKLPMYYPLLDYGYLQFEEKKTKVLRLLTFYFDKEEATKIVDMIAPLIKEADDDYLQGMIGGLPRRQEEGRLQKIRDCLTILSTMGNARSGTIAG